MDVDRLRVVGLDVLADVGVVRLEIGAGEDVYAAGDSRVDERAGAVAWNHDVVKRLRCEDSVTFECLRRGGDTPSGIRRAPLRQARTASSWSLLGPLGPASLSLPCCLANPLETRRAKSVLQIRPLTINGSAIKVKPKGALSWADRPESPRTDARRARRARLPRPAGVGVDRARSLRLRGDDEPAGRPPGGRQARHLPVAGGSAGGPLPHLPGAEPGSPRSASVCSRRFRSIRPA